MSDQLYQVLKKADEYDDEVLDGTTFWVGRPVTAKRTYLTVEEIGEAFRGGGTFVYWQVDGESYRTPEEMTIKIETSFVEVRP